MQAIITSFGYSPLTSNLLSAPVYLFALVVTVAVSVRSDQQAERFWWIIWPSVLCAVSFVLQAIGMHM